ncbi:MAG: biotin--[acetyl-CoA-carboxylase] ligase, partial [Stenotrophobium sp.]
GKGDRPMAQPLSETDLLALVDALSDGNWHSGEDLASAAAISRAALAKRVEKLRDWQLDIEARHGLGYRLSAPLQRFDVRTLRAASDVAVQVATVVDSTNAQLLATEAAQDPQALFAEFQTAGRGRRGRNWASPFGANLYVSLAWSFAQWPQQLTALPLAVGVVCARALRACGLTDAGIKWPNDLLVDGRKLGGILIEHRAEAGGPCRVVIGIGINVAMTHNQARDVTQPWISLHEACKQRGLSPIPRNVLAASLLSTLVQGVREFAQSGFASFSGEWHALDLTHNHAVTILSQDRELHGTGRGVDAQGALVVEVLGQFHTIHSGEVSLRLA